MLQAFGLVEARAQIDPGIKAKKGADRDGVGGEPRQEHGNDRKSRSRLSGRRLTFEAELNLAVLPLTNTLGSDQHDERVARPHLMLEPGLPRLAGRKAVAVKKCAKACLCEARPQRLRRGAVRPGVAEKDVVSLPAAHEITIHNPPELSRRPVIACSGHEPLQERATAPGAPLMQWDRFG